MLISDLDTLHLILTGLQKPQIGSSDMNVDKIPEGWHLEEIDGDLEDTPFHYYDLPPAKLLLFNFEWSCYLVECGGRHVLWYDVSGEMDQIEEPKDLNSICNALPDMSKLKLVPLVREDTESVVKPIPKGWSTYEQYLQNDMWSPFDRYNLSPGKKLLYNHSEGKFLLESDGRHFFYEKQCPEELVEVLDPRTFDDIIQAMSNGEEVTQIRMTDQIQRDVKHTDLRQHSSEKSNL